MPRKCRTGAGRDRARAAGKGGQRPAGADPQAASQPTREVSQWLWPAVQRPAWMRLEAPPTMRIVTSEIGQHEGRAPFPPGRGGGVAAARGEGRFKAVQKNADIWGLIW